MAAPKPTNDVLPITRPQAVRLLGIGERTFARLEAAGVLAPLTPRKGRRAGTYDAFHIVRAYLAHLASAAVSERLNAMNERARRDKVTADLGEQKLAQIRGEVLARAVYEQELTPVLLAFRTKTLAAPRAWAPTLTRAATEGVAAVERELTSRTRELLTVLSTLPAREKTKGEKR